MKTKPVENVLPLSVEAQTVMDVYSDAIHEMVCRGTHIFAESLKRNKSKETITEIDIAAPLLFRHILELMDAISVQVKSGVIVPCKVYLRAIPEVVVSLEYLLRENTEEIAACFFIVD
ncbi:DUF5677 domain-containing protein [Spirosoma endbachense]|uniref:Uncharacterized protein n=1 Tax=Spirosoma endbachense TaxID=2666025 RepID=A0A6P1W335_9BACT|nr:DUF5677 domain-containing protein [Spirosoma endbachense]QHV99304.1 hypothetical protein GJR95_31725 [Spirosoma endbachense]